MPCSRTQHGFTRVGKNEFGKLDELQGEADKLN